MNDDLAPAVCLFTIVNISWASSGLMWLLNLDKVDTETEPLVGISILNELLWISAVIVPFVQVNMKKIVLNTSLYITCRVAKYLKIKIMNRTTTK